jgi:hypothetical protein
MNSINSSAYLILRSAAERRVSKDGQQTGCSCPPFETLTAFAPQGEVIVGLLDPLQSRPERP